MKLILKPDKGSLRKVPLGAMYCSRDETVGEVRRLVAPNRTTLRYYRRNTPYGAIPQ